MERKLPGKIVGNLGIPRKAVLFLEISEKSVPFATWSYQKFKPEALVEWKAPIVFKTQVESQG